MLLHWSSRLFLLCHRAPCEALLRWAARCWSLSLKWCGSVKSYIVKRSIINAGRKINISLEEDFWDSLQKIANYRDMTLSSLVTAIGAQGNQRKLSSVIRLYILNFYRERRDRDNRHKSIQPVISSPIRIRTLH